MFPVETFPLAEPLSSVIKVLGRGGAGRQSDPESAQAFVSAEDHLVRRHLPPMVRKMTLSGDPRLARGAFSLAQRRAQKLAWKQGLAVLRADAWLDEALSFTEE